MKRYLSLALACIMVFCLAACSGDTASSAPAASQPSAGTSEPVVGAENTLPPTDLTIGTASTSGTYYVVGAAIGNTVAKKNDSLEIMVISTAGGMENVSLVVGGDIEIGMANTDALFDAYYGENTYADLGSQPVRGVMALYPSVSHVLVRRDSGITSWEDLRGKKVCLGAMGSSHPIASRALLAQYGINYETDIEAYYLTGNEMMDMLADGDLDCVMTVGGTPASSVVNAIATTPLDLLDPDPSVVDGVCTELPYFVPCTIPSGTYPGIDYDVNAVGLTTCFFVREDMSEEVVYQFVKTAMENLADYVDTNESCQYITPETVADMPIPLHPGAERYYHEMGWID